MRKMLTMEDIEHNAACFKRQMENFIDFSDGKALMVNNADWLLKLISAVDFDDYESLQYFQRVLIHTGVIDALREAGIQEGDTVSMYDLEFDFVN